MWKAFLLLTCVAGSIAVPSDANNDCEDTGSNVAEPSSDQLTPPSSSSNSSASASSSSSSSSTPNNDCDDTGSSSSSNSSASASSSSSSSSTENISTTTTTNPTGEPGPTVATNPTGGSYPTREKEPTGKTEPNPDDTACTSTDESGYPPICGRNEVYYNCSGECVPRRCSEIGYPLNCDKKCTPGCVCKEGYVRGDDGHCIPIPDCKSCAGDRNATQGCSNYCGNTCSDYNKPPAACAQYCIVNGCACRKGYVYDSKVGYCVKPIDCSKPHICPKNEVYYNCSGECVPRRCSEIGYPLNCDKKCTPGCVCQDGMVRADNGTCIAINDCPSCAGDRNATQGCSNYCGNTCSDYNKPPGYCPLYCVNNGCQCKKGYVYDSNQKICVDPKDCTPTCKVNEEYSSCINGGCGAKNCSQINQPDICIDPVTCIKGCVCVKGYLRASNGTCVPKDQCPRKCTGQYEYYETCILGCSNQTCGSINQTYQCPLETGCKSGCRCIKGYYRDGIGGKCIKEDECPKPCGVNEHYEDCYYNCGGNETCDDIGKSYSCPAHVECQSGCRCDKGYYRNKKNVCIPESQCPPVCPAGEVYDECPTVKCEGDLCPKTRNSPQTCPVGIVCDKPRCVCGYNRKRDRKTNRCIPIPDCPPFKCGHNEEYQACSSSCPGEKCSDYINQTKCPPYNILIAVNCRPQCKCIKGYYRNSEGKCIPACECTADTSVDKS